MNHLAEILTSKLIFKIMQQKQTLRPFHILILMIIFALKSNSASLKTEVDTLNIDKLVPVPVDLSKLSDAAKNDVVKKKCI